MRRRQKSRTAAATTASPSPPTSNPEREAALEGEIGEHPLAEAVDGEHVRPVDVVHRAFEPPGGQREVDVSRPALPCRQELASPRVDRRLGGAAVRRFVGVAETFRAFRPGRAGSAGESRPDRVEQHAEDVTDPIPQLGGGGPGEGHHEDPVDRPSFLGDQAGDEGGEGVCLAGSGAGFDERRARTVEGEVERGMARRGPFGGGHCAHRHAPAGVMDGYR